MPTIDAPDAGLPTAVIAMPGTGSDADYIRRAFGPAADALDVELIALQPRGQLVSGHLRALDELAEHHHRVLVGGVSIGAAIAVDWALTTGATRCRGVLAALPAWSGDPTSAIAAHSARATAAALRTDGLEPTIDAMSRTTPAWLSAELSRSWRALYPDLLRHLDDAAGYRAPDRERIADLRCPLAITAAVDDPVHPLPVALEWASAAQSSAVVEVTLEEWGHEPSVLGDSCVTAWRRLVGLAPA